MLFISVGGHLKEMTHKYSLRDALELFYCMVAMCTGAAFHSNSSTIIEKCYNVY